LKALKMLLVLIVSAITISSFVLMVSASPRWEDCDLDGFSDATGEPVPWIGFDDEHGDQVPANWDGQTHDWGYYPENQPKAPVPAAPISETEQPALSETVNGAAELSPEVNAAQSSPEAGATPETDAALTSPIEATIPTSSETENSASSNNDTEAARTQPTEPLKTDGAQEANVPETNPRAAETADASSPAATPAANGVQGGGAESNAAETTNVGIVTSGTDDSTTFTGLLILAGLAVVGALVYIMGIFDRKTRQLAAAAISGGNGQGR